MTLSMQLMTFTTHFSNNKAENRRVILALSSIDGNVAIVVVNRVPEKHTVVIFGFVYNRQNLKS